MREQGSGSSPVTFCRLTSVCSTTTDRLQASDQVRSLQHNTVVHFQWPRHLHNQIQPCIVQPPWSRPLYSQYGLLHCTNQIQPYFCTRFHGHAICTAVMASHDIQPAIVALALYKLVQSVLNVSPLYNKVWLSIVQRWGKPYSEHVLAAPGYEARSDLTHTSMQAWLRSQGCKLCVNMYWQHLALGPGLT